MQTLYSRVQKKTKNLWHFGIFRKNYGQNPNHTFQNVPLFLNLFSPKT